MSYKQQTKEYRQEYQPKEYQPKEYRQEYQPKEYRQEYRQEYQPKEYRQEDRQTSRTHEKKEYAIPEKPYALDECMSAEDEICHMTNRYAGFAFEVKDRLFSRLDHRKNTVSIYGRFNAPSDREMVEKINGGDQYFLKMTMQASDIDLIWYDREYNKYRFWGATKFKVVDAMNRIRSRIIKYAVHVPADQQPQQALKTVQCQVPQAAHQEKLKPKSTARRCQISGKKNCRV
jgi:hypothetical protein